MKYYQVVGSGDAGPIFRFTVTAKNFSEALIEISKDYYMTDMTDILYIVKREYSFKLTNSNSETI